jgi:hypothetical protein
MDVHLAGQLPCLIADVADVLQSDDLPVGRLFVKFRPPL